MLKKFVFSLLAVASLTFVGCDQLKEAIKIGNITKTQVVSLGALQKGQRAPVTGTRDTTILFNDVNDALKTAGATASLVSKIEITGIEISIPAASPWGFENIGEMEVFMDDKSLGKYTGGKSGKTLQLDIPTSIPNLKTAILSGSTKLGYYVLAKEATTSQPLSMRLTVATTL